jgi:hypothetical protein
MVRTYINFACEISLSHSEGIFICCKILRHEADGFTSPPDVIIRICFALKIHRPRPGLNPRTLGPVAIKITTRLPRPT